MKKILFSIVTLAFSNLFIITAQEESVINKASFGLFNTSKDAAFEKDDTIEDGGTRIYAGADGVNDFNTHDKTDMYSLGFYFPGDFTFGSFTRAGLVLNESVLPPNTKKAGDPIVVPSGTYEWTEETSTITDYSAEQDFLLVEQGIYFQGDVAWGLELSFSADSYPDQGSLTNSYNYYIEHKYYKDFETYDDSTDVPDIREAYSKNISMLNTNTELNISAGLPIHFNVGTAINSLELLFQVYSFSTSFQNTGYYSDETYMGTLPLSTGYLDTLSSLYNTHGVRAMVFSISDVINMPGITSFDERNRGELSFYAHTSLASSWETDSLTETEYYVNSSQTDIDDRNLQGYDFYYIRDVIDDFGLEIGYRENMYLNFGSAVQIGMAPGLSISGMYDFDSTGDLFNFTPSSAEIFQEVDVDGDGYTNTGTDYTEYIERTYTSNGETRSLIFKSDASFSISSRIKPDNLPVGLLIGAEPVLTLVYSIDTKMPIAYDESSYQRDLAYNVISSSSSSHTIGEEESSHNFTTRFRIDYSAVLFIEFTPSIVMYVSMFNTNLEAVDHVDVEVEFEF